MTYDELARRYCDRQGQTPAGLLAVLQDQKAKFKPFGWVLLECQDMSSSYMGTLTVLPFGPNNTFRSPPDRPVSPRGIASDMSTTAGVLTVDDLPDTLPASLSTWTAPPAPPKTKKRKARR